MVEDTGSGGRGAGRPHVSIMAICLYLHHERDNVRRLTEAVICSFACDALKAADLANPRWKSRVDHSCGVRRQPPPPRRPPPRLSLLCVGDLDPTAAPKHHLRQIVPTIMSLCP
ncbi:hypothetical protein ACJJTC_012245 [Scirpophaga incertulas]